MQSDRRRQHTFLVLRFGLILISTLLASFPSTSPAAPGPGQWVATVLDDKPRYFRSSYGARTIHFRDPDHGVCAGSGLWKTLDGGFTWKPVAIPKILNRKTKKEGHGWRFVRMVSRTEIWACGQLGEGGVDQTQLLRSNDGGKTWTEVLAGKLDRAGPLRFEGPTWWVLSERTPVAHASRDRGKTWKRVRLGGSDVHLFDLDFPADEVGFLVGGRAQKGGAVWKTADGGKTWEPLPFPETQPYMLRCSFVSATAGWVGGGRGQIWRTKDGGQTWQRCPAPFRSNQTLTGVTFFPSGEGFVSADVPYGKQSVSRLTADLAVAYTPDRGKTWTPLLKGFKSISDMFFLDRDHAWACGHNRGEVPGALLYLYER